MGRVLFLNCKVWASLARCTLFGSKMKNNLAGTATWEFSYHIQLVFFVCFFFKVYIKKMNVSKRDN